MQQCVSGFLKDYLSYFTSSTHVQFTHCNECDFCPSFIFITHSVEQRQWLNVQALCENCFLHTLLRVDELQQNTDVGRSCLNMNIKHKLIAAILHIRSNIFQSFSDSQQPQTIVLQFSGWGKLYILFESLIHFIKVPWGKLHTRTAKC